jgi:hypothetical protein
MHAYQQVACASGRNDAGAAGSVNVYGYPDAAAVCSAIIIARSNYYCHYIAIIIAMIIARSSAASSLRHEWLRHGWINTRTSNLVTHNVTKLLAYIRGSRTIQANKI